MSLLAAALIEFDCELPSTVSVYPDRGRERRLAKRAKVSRTVLQFEALMRSDNTPKSEAELIAALTPVVTILLSWFVRQLVIQVLKYCWKQWHS